VSDYVLAGNCKENEFMWQHRFPMYCRYHFLHASRSRFLNDATEDIPGNLPPNGRTRTTHASGTIEAVSSRRNAPNFLNLTYWLSLAGEGSLGGP
jgi:hypothetical protein